MPVDVVKLNIATSTATVAQETYNDVAVIGRSDSAPEFGYATPRRYSSATDVAEDFGDGSDVHVSSQALDAMGATDWIVLVLDETGQTEQFTDLSSDSFELATTPLSGTTPAEITIDGDALEVTPVTGTPDSIDLEEGEAELNYDTGEVALGTDPTGTEATIEVAYSTVEFTNGIDALDDLGPDVAIFADLHAGREDVGDLNYLASWASGSYCAMPVALENGATYESESQALDAAHDVSAAVSSPNVLPIAHKSSDDVAAYIAGQLAVEQPWHDPLFYGDSYPGLSTETYRRSTVGEPGQTGTFEGGDGDGNGGVNVLINVQGTTVLSNSLTSAGAASNYRYLDVWRTEGFITDQAENALIGLALRQNQIPFNNMGRALIQSALKESLLTYVGDRQPFSEINISVPSRDQLSDENIGNRIWGPISIDGTLAGNTHQFEVEFAASL